MVRSRQTSGRRRSFGGLADGLQHDLSAAGHDVGDDDLLGIVDVHKVRNAAAEAVPGTQDGGTRVGIARVHMTEDDLGGDLLFGGQAALGMLRQTGLHVADKRERGAVHLQAAAVAAEAARPMALMDIWPISPKMPR